MKEQNIYKIIAFASDDELCEGTNNEGIVGVVIAPPYKIESVLQPLGGSFGELSESIVDYMSVAKLTPGKFQFESFKGSWYEMFNPLTRELTNREIEELRKELLKIGFIESKQEVKIK